MCVLEQYPTEEDMIEWAKRESEREERERVARLTQQEQEDLELAIALSKSEFSWPEPHYWRKDEELNLRVLGFHYPTSFSTVPISPLPLPVSHPLPVSMSYLHIASDSSQNSVV